MLDQFKTHLLPVLRPGESTRQWQERFDAIQNRQDSPAEPQENATMYRIDATYRQHEQTYVIDSRAALDRANELFNKIGAEIELLNIYDDHGKLVYHYNDREKPTAEMS